MYTHRTLLKYYAVLSLRGRVQKTLPAHWQEGQALEVENLHFFWIYDLFGVELTQFVKVAESYTATVAPKKKIISFLMANNG